MYAWGGGCIEARRAECGVLGERRVGFLGRGSSSPTSYEVWGAL